MRMRPRRGHLFWGITLLLLGAVPLAVRAGLVPAEALSDAWRLWPVALIAVGVALILFRRASGTAGIAAAAVAVGLIGGTALAGGGSAFSFVDCGRADATASSRSTLTESGSLTNGARVSLELNCGELELGTAEGDGWTFQADYTASAPEIEATSDSLEIRSGGGPFNRRQGWQIELPASRVVDELEIDTNAGTTTLDLGDAQLGVIDVETNAGEVIVRAGDAEVGGLSVSANAGTLRVTLGSVALTGDLSANAGSMELCVPDEVDLRLVLTENITFSHNLDDLGLSQSGTTWSRPGDGDRITLEVEGNAASFELNPDGGCG